ncbi:hypothetical protein CEE34_01020 [Candidatus Aerophobetes bacterium Ae_b3a]|nr:MAG: hypothetical protein CEE34_01020 [Candidatus Aerophobetes bacterium Ae_b3a]
MLKKFHRIFSVPGILIIFFCFSFALLGAEFSADLKIKQPDEDYEFEYYAEDSLYRVEKLTGEDRILIIADRELDITWALNPEEKTYIELKGIDAAFFNPVRAWEAIRESLNEEKVGDETVLGYLCEKYTYTYPEQKEPSAEGWYSPKLNQFIRQIVYYGAGQGDGLLEMTNIIEAPQDDSLFKVPADYQREKSPAEKVEEKEAARPVLTRREETIAPAGRYMGTGGALRVKVEPDKSVRVIIRSQIKEKSVYKITPLRDGQPVEAEVIESGLSGKGQKAEPFFGHQLKLNEILIEIEEGLISAFVTKEYSSFDEVKREEYFLLEESQRGLFVYEDYKIVLTLTGDSQAAEDSPVKIIFYKGEYEDVLKEEDFKLTNGQVRKWEFNPGQIRTLNITAGESGGVKLLLEQFPAKVKELSKEEKQQLVQDIIHNELDKVKALLDSGLDVNMNASATDSLLMAVCRYSNSEMLKLVLNYNPQINFQDDYGNNALTLAVNNFDNYKGMIPLLLQAGADPDSKVGSPGKINFTALGKMTGKALVSKNEKDCQIIEMFLSHGADPNQTPKSGTTPLMQAAYKGNVKFVKLFLKYGADTSLKDKQGKTALDMAKNKNQQQVIDLLQ